MLQILQRNQAVKMVYEAVKEIQMTETYLYNHLCWAVSAPRRLTAVSNMNPKEELREGLVVQTGNRSKIQEPFK